MKTKENSNEIIGPNTIVIKQANNNINELGAGSDNLESTNHNNNNNNNKSDDVVQLQVEQVVDNINLLDDDQDNDVEFDDNNLTNNIKHNKNEDDEDEDNKSISASTTTTTTTTSSTTNLDKYETLISTSSQVIITTTSNQDDDEEEVDEDDDDDDGINKINQIISNNNTKSNKNFEQQQQQQQEQELLELDSNHHSNSTNISSNLNFQKNQIQLDNNNKVDCSGGVSICSGGGGSSSTRYEHNLTKEIENKAVDEFLKIQNWSSSDAKNWNIAVKFLMARKFDVDRAIKLYNDHENLRKKEGLDYINLNDIEFIKELETGKFTVLPFVKNYPICALFTVKLHNGCSTPEYELTTLKTLIYQLDAALENPDAQRNGINFIYDMNNCKRSNYDLSLSQKILTLVRGSYPARLNKLFVVAAPFWFKCIVKVLSILMREKLRERVLFVTNEELKNQIPIEILPDYLGGLVKINHSNWLIECNKLVTNKASTCSYYYYTKASNNSNNNQNGDLTINNSNNNNNNNNNNTNSLNKESEQIMQNTQQSRDTTRLQQQQDEFNTNRKRQSSDFIDLDEKKHAKKQISNNSVVYATGTFKDLLNEKMDPLPFNNLFQSIQNVDISSVNGFTVNELVDHVLNVGAFGLSDEFKIIRNQSIVSSFDAFKERENAFKNRYRDVICLDESRILLTNDKDWRQTSNFSDENKNDYIHANYVDGYKQKNAYISTQGPLDETVEDFWRMIWQQVVLVIAMTTKVVEQRKLKCAQYWPLEKGENMRIDDLFEIKNTSVEDLEDYRVSKLTIKHLPSDQIRNIVHCQFLSWPDHGVPKTASHILDFIDLVRKNQRDCLKQLNSNTKTKWNGHPLGPPICVHCSAGIGRTGTFCAIDISINRLNDCKTVNILDTVNKIRLQRAQSVQMRDQYVFCYLAVLEYAQRENLLADKKINLAQLFDSLF